jgi:hypothetical protein
VSVPIPSGITLGETDLTQFLKKKKKKKKIATFRSRDNVCDKKKRKVLTHEFRACHTSTHVLYLNEKPVQMVALSAERNRSIISSNKTSTEKELEGEVKTHET